MTIVRVALGRFKCGLGIPSRQHARRASTTSSPFAELGLVPELCSALEKIGLSRPTDIQKIAIQKGLEGKNIYCHAPTGTGKTLAYMLPMIHHLRVEEETQRLENAAQKLLNRVSEENEAQQQPIVEKALRQKNRPRALILVPSRELGIQVAQVAKSLSHESNFSTALLTSGIPKRQLREAVNRPVDFLIATPGKLQTFLREQKVYLSNIKFIAMDESDTIYDRTGGFREMIDDIVTIAQKGASYRQRSIQFLLASATMKSDVEKIIFRRVKDLELLSRGNIHQVPLTLKEHFVRVENGPTGKHVALRSLLNAAPGAKTLVFCNSASSCRSTEHMLSENQFSSTSLHKEIPPVIRKQNYRAFVSGSTSILVCTDVAARGLDIASIDQVILFDFPLSVVEYLHRVGRCARAGRTGSVHSLVLKHDMNLANEIQQSNKKRYIASLGRPEHHPDSIHEASNDARPQECPSIHTRSSMTKPRLERSKTHRRNRGEMNRTKPRGTFSRSKQQPLRQSRSSR